LNYVSSSISLTTLGVGKSVLQLYLGDIAEPGVKMEEEQANSGLLTFSRVQIILIPISALKWPSGEV